MHARAYAHPRRTRQWAAGLFTLWLAGGLSLSRLARPQGESPSVAAPSSSVSAPTESDWAMPATSVGSQVSGRAPSIKAALEKLVREIHDLDATVGVAIVDISTGDMLAAHQEHRPFNPASNAKVITTAAALALLGPNHRFDTTLSTAHKHLAATLGSVTLTGSGDPSLRTQDLWEFVHRLQEAGVKKIEGDVLVNQRFFDEQFVPPAFEQQPNEWAYFRAPVSAISLDENTVTMIVHAGSHGAGALVAFDPPGLVDVEGSIKTGAASSAQNLSLHLTPSGTRLVAHIGGSIPEGSPTIPSTKRVDNPQLSAGYALKALLSDAGISVTGTVKPGNDDSHETAIATHTSAPLSTLLYELGKQSNNFYAEMIFKAIALEEKGRPAKDSDAVDAVTSYLRSIGAWEDGDVIKNGSGLYDANRVTPASMVKVLRSAAQNPSIANEMVAQLSIGGVDGTLRHRMRNLRSKRDVRAKTGTLKATVALSGYVLGPPGKGSVAFSILVNHVEGKGSKGREAMDSLVEAIERWLWASSNE